MDNLKSFKDSLEKYGLEPADKIESFTYQKSLSKTKDIPRQEGNGGVLRIANIFTPSKVITKKPKYEKVLLITLEIATVTYAALARSLSAESIREARNVGLLKSKTFLYAKAERIV